MNFMDTHQYFPKQVEKGLLRFRTEIRSVENASDNNVGSGGPGALGWATASVGCELFFSVLLVLALLARGTCADLLLWQLGWVEGQL